MLHHAVPHLTRDRVPDETLVNPDENGNMVAVLTDPDTGSVVQPAAAQDPFPLPGGAAADPFPLPDDNPDPFPIPADQPSTDAEKWPAPAPLALTTG